MKKQWLTFVVEVSRIASKTSKNSGGIEDQSKNCNYPDHNKN